MLSELRGVTVELVVHASVTNVGKTAGLATGQASRSQTALARLGLRPTARGALAEGPCVLGVRSFDCARGVRRLRIEPRLNER